MLDTRHRQAAAWPDLEAYLEELDDEGKADTTLYAYERQIAPLLRAHPDAAFADFDKPMILRELRKVPQKSRYISKSIYNGWFAWGMREDLLDRNPVDKIRKMPAGDVRPKTLFSEAEVEILTSRPSPDGALWAILFGTGLRRADAINLQRGHINLDGLTPRLTVWNGKGGKDAVIPFRPELAAAIADLDLLERLDPDDHLWNRRVHNVSRKTRISSTQFDRWYRAELQAAGIPHRNPHQTRHTYHWILRHVRNLDLEERQILMRHSSPTTTVRQYGVVDIEDIARKLVEA
jgi:integrase